MSEQHDLEAQERAAQRIGDRQAAAKARARIDDLAAQNPPKVSGNARSREQMRDNAGLMDATALDRLYPELFD